jgi:hypothetical protein
MTSTTTLFETDITSIRNSFRLSNRKKIIQKEHLKISFY